MANIYFNHNAIYIRFRYAMKQHNIKLNYKCNNNYKEYKTCSCRGCLSARNFAERLQNAINNGSYNEKNFFPDRVKDSNDETLFFDMVDEFMVVAELSHTTRRGYESIVRYLKSYFAFNTLIKDIKRRDIEMMRVELLKTLNPKTVNNRLAFCSKIFERAIDSDLIIKNPVKGLLVKNQRPEIEPFSLSEVKMIIDKALEIRPDLAIYFAIAAYTGMRSGEILALTKNDIDLEKKRIKVSKTCSTGVLKNSTKTYNIRYVPIIDELAGLIENHFHFMAVNEYSDRILISQYGKPIIQYQSISKVWIRILKELNLGYRQQYQLRHTFACLMLDADEVPADIANALGHSDLTMLFKTYGKWRSEKDGRVGKKFAELIKTDKK